MIAKGIRFCRLNGSRKQKKFLISQNIRLSRIGTLTISTWIVLCSIASESSLNRNGNG